MNAKKIIKGIVKLGVVGGIAFAAYKLGECNGEVNERMREKYGDEDDDGIGSDDDEDDYRFYDNMDEPDDWCLAPASGAVTPYDIGQEYTISEEVPAEKCEVPDEPHEKEKPLPQKENKECVKKEVVPPPVRKYAPLSSIKIRGISRYEIETLLIWMLRHGAFYKTDLIYEPEVDPVQRLKDEFEPKGIRVFPISGATGKGISELLYYVSSQLDQMDTAPVIFEQEYFPDDEVIYEDLPYTVEQIDGMYVVEGPKIEKMLGYTNLDSEKGFAFFQKFLKDSGILEDLETAGIQEGDTVRMYGLQFDYYK